MRLANAMLQTFVLLTCGAVGSSAEPAYAQEQADVADVPSQDLTVRENQKMRYFLIGAADGAATPEEPYGLLVVLPGGDGSSDFNPFLRRMHKHVLGSRWLVAQAVAPRWDDKQFDKVVWPTAGLPYAGAKFTTEELIEAIIADVRARSKIDVKRVFLLGWSSGGPACYATMLRKESSVTGAFIAMSIFKPNQLPSLENAKGKPVYLLQSPDDRVTPFVFAEEAEKALGAAGCKVQLKQYAGGHGWLGNVWDMIGEGIQWLEKPETATANTPAPLSFADPGLEDPAVGKKPAAWFLPGIFYTTELGYKVESETKAVFAGERCARLERVDPKGNAAFGNLMQVIDATPYRGKRVRYRAAVRTEVEGEKNTAQLWLRVDRVDKNKNEVIAFFDNMHERPIRSNEWRHYEIVGDVASDANDICLGMILVGSGQAWLDDASFEVVGADVALTGAEAEKTKVSVPADKASGNVLANPSFEDGDKTPADWKSGADIDGVEYVWDKNVGHKGKASLCLNKTAKRYFPVAQWYQIVAREADRPSLKVSTQVKAEAVTKAIIDVIFLDENDEMISHEWAAYIGAKEAKDPPAQHDWKEYQGKVKIPAKAKKIQIGLQIYGPGKVWFDEIKAEYVD